ncbi:MAG: hypothetical protein M3Y27_18915 [Acidobacteriota bacterium]|nr:hypothetical protein [Acidobacteriota bacterium]
MPKSDIERDFPKLINATYDTSDEDFNHNCLAFAVGDYHNWWEPPSGHGQYWPPGFSEDVTVQTVESIIRVHGFTVELDVNAHPESDAIAIYAEGNDWSHFARFSNGAWACKLGGGHDVYPIRLKDLEGSVYGRVVKILARPKNNFNEGTV